MTDDLLLKSKTIAVVGLSRSPSKDSHSVSEYMIRNGYRVIPVNPTATEILGEKAYPSLLDIPPEHARAVEIVNIFRPSNQVPPIVQQAVKLRARYERNPKLVWMQLGIENAAAAKAAREAGMAVVEDLCIRVEHRRVSHSQRENW